METLGKCAAPGCDNAFDPRWFVHINGRAEQACDGHGCCSGDPCAECKRDNAASVLAAKVLSEPSDDNECAICHTTFSVPGDLQPTALCNLCAQTAAASLAEYAAQIIAGKGEDVA